MNSILRFLTSDDGPAAVEYAVLLALLVGMMVASIQLVGNEYFAISDRNAEALDAALTPSN